MPEDTVRCRLWRVSFEIRAFWVWHNQGTHLAGRFSDMGYRCSQHSTPLEPCWFTDLIHWLLQPWSQDETGKVLIPGRGQYKELQLSAAGYGCSRLEAGQTAAAGEHIKHTGIAKATCLVWFPLLVGGKRFSRPAKELAPATGKIYAGICLMSHSSCMSFG